MKDFHLGISLLCAIFLCVLQAPGYAATGDIITLAGGGGGIDENIAATGASLSSPYGVAVDNAGNLYIADRGHNRIRKVSALTGLISTVAGNGAAGFSGDNGKATAASLNSPTGVAVDSAGNYYIADQANNRIRKVSAETGIITTVAGNGTNGYSGDNSAATLASLAAPSGVALDSAGNLLIADWGNNRIRKVTSGGAIITTVAGNGVAGFSGDNSAATSANLNHPTGVAVDRTGNLFIADTGNARIRKVSAGIGIITTLYEAQSYLHLRGVAVDNAGNVYFGESNFSTWYGPTYSVIKKIDASTGFGDEVAAGGYFSGWNGDNGAATAISLCDPAGVTLDSTGNLFIADTGNNRIRRVSAATGIISTVAGNGRSVYIGEDGAATGATLDHPDSVTVDSAGDLYIADQGNNRLWQVSAGTGIITTVYQPNTPFGVAIDRARNIYIAEYRNNRILKLDATSRVISLMQLTGSGPYARDGLGATVNFPLGMAVDDAGNLYVADQYDARIRKIDTRTGVISTVAGNGTQGFSGDYGAATAASLSQPSGLAVDRAGNLYIADADNFRIRRVDAGTGIITTVAGIGGVREDLFSGDNGPATEAGLSYPTGVAVDDAGNLYIADQDNNRVRKVSAQNGVITTVAGNGVAGFSGDGSLSTAASLHSPTGVAVDGAGNLYLADFNNNRIRKVSEIVVPDAPTGISAIPGNAQATVSFIAPAANGESGITEYTVTSEPGNLAATGTTSPITVTGLTNDIAYTFTVVATNPAGSSRISAPSPSVSYAATHDGIINPVNGKSAPDITDALIVLRYVAGINTLGATQLAHADVAPMGTNGKPIGNGMVDIADVIMILRRAVGVGVW